MSMFHLIFFIWVLLTASLSVVIGSVSWCPHHGLSQRVSPKRFEQRTDRFWEFNGETGTWVEVELPYDLVACVDGNCTKVGSIGGGTTSGPNSKDGDDDHDGDGQLQGTKETETSHPDDDELELVLPVRKRVSLTKMSETSIWVTGESGSIYERFWNGAQWVLAPHDLPIPVEHAISVFIVNLTILALSETGNLYQLQLSETAQPVWALSVPRFDQSTDKEEKSSQVLIKSGVVSHDTARVYFCTKNGSLLELSEFDPPRWLNHGQPPGANVQAIADAGSIRSQVVYTISSVGELYEFDSSSKPLWKKHIWRDGSLQPIKGVTLHDLIGDLSTSLFLLTKDGKLVERRLHQRKWKWIVHGRPKDQHLTCITQAQQGESSDKLYSLFLTSSYGSVFEYKLSKKAGNAQDNPARESWTSHDHPPNARATRGISGLQFQVGRIVFMLDDGRLAELHLSGIGGENSGPSQQVNARRKAAMKYVWTVLEAPETEGWNGEYCSEERGPMNCIMGIKDEPNDSVSTRLVTRRRKGNQNQDYVLPSSSRSRSSMDDDHRLSANLIGTNFRMRLMQEGRSFFLITGDGFTFEYLYAESAWIWLRHEHSATTIKGAVGNYNGSLFVVDSDRSLLIRERSSTELAWINCTAMRKGKRVLEGSPWDSMPGRASKVTAQDSLFFVGENGRLLQFIVALRKFKWKDCKNPPNTRVACIVDQELFRESVVFVVGENGRLYQYNKVSGLWHEHYQSQHLVLSRLPGTAMRPSSTTLLNGSIFMLSKDGGLVEYHWNAMDGWNWVEHGAPHKGVVLVGSLGPAFQGNQLFSIGADGNVYLRYMDQLIWKWKNCGFPNVGNMEDQRQERTSFCTNEDFTANPELQDNLSHISTNCDPKIAPTRPIPFSHDSVIFELRDGRLAELKRIEGSDWVWSRTIGTPTSLCMENYWTALAS